MGEVYAAVDERLGRRIALKLLSSGHEGSYEQRMRMLREAQAASALNDPGIVTLYDLGAHEGRLYLVMELVDGESFRVIAMRGIPPAEALILVAEAADALGVAHAAGILHRDIKGDNLMRARDGRVKVLDFGLAKIVDEGLLDDTSAEVLRELASGPRFEIVPEPPPGQNVTLRGRKGAAAPPPPPPPDEGHPLLETQAGTMLGTPSYMAPEQTRGEQLTERSDVFSLGIVLYELLTGARPFARGTLYETIAAVRECAPQPPSKRAPDRRISGEIDKVVLDAMARFPEDRTPNMPAFAAALRAVAAAPPRRRRWPWIAAGGAALLALGGAGLALRRSDPGPVVSGPARRVTFDPGCEEFPSFTPDGRTLVFDAQVEGGDYEIFAMDLAQGTRRRLTNARGWDYAAAVSPDGTRIAYTHQSDSNSVRVLPMSGAGDPIVLGQSDSYAAWTPRGTVLYGVADRIMEWDGASHEIATVPQNRRALFFAPFPDGRVYAVIGTIEQEVAPMIAVLADGRMRPTEIADAAEYPIAPAPDGEHLYHHRTTAAGVELVRRPRDGGAARVLQGGVAAVGGLAFAPGGARLAYSTCKSSSFLARIVSGRAVPLTRAGGWTDGWPTVLDGRHLLFTSDRAGTSQVWRLDLETGATAPFAPPGTLRAAVSPDRRQVAWAALDPPGIRVAPVGAGGTVGEARRITDHRGDTGPQLSPDGTQVLFVRIDDSGGERVWAVPAVGGEPRAVTPPHGAVASISPVADEVVYLLSRGEDGVDVLATDLRGRTPELVVSLPAGVFRSLRHAPDGKRLIVIREDQEILEIDRGERAHPASVTSLWRGGADSATAVDYAPDGTGLVASVVQWEGDLWMVDGRF
jgi:Tol biopolymer transport system component